MVCSTPGLAVAEEFRDQGIHTRLAVPGSGHTTDIGKPEIPVIRRLVIVPQGMEPSVSWKGNPERIILSNLGFRGPLHPSQRPVPKIPGAMEKAPFEKDALIYSSDTWIPANPVAMLEAGQFHGQRLMLLEITPVQYNPAQDAILMFPQLDVSITFQGPKTENATALLRSGAATLETLTLNAGILTPADETAGKRLLIISGNAFTNSLGAYIAHKQAQGWSVDMFGTSAAGTTTNQIQSFIRARFQNITTRPSALLLVGDTDSVPRFIGTQEDNPDTDLYYACMDGAADWMPDFPVGRLSVVSAGNLTSVLSKSVAMETNTPASWNRQFAFMAGTDQAAITEGTHDYVISTYLTPRSLASDKLYQSSFGATPSQVSAAFNSGRTMGIYSGHGTETEWADGPPFDATDVNALRNTARYPFVCSFACLTGRFGHFTPCFAEIWLRAPTNGAAAVLASSVTSFWDEDDILEKKLFECLFSQATPEAGNCILAAKQQYLLHFGSTATTRRYFEMYNLLGDPTLKLLRRPPVVAPDVLQSAYISEPYVTTFVADTTQPPCTWELGAGTLPPGLGLNTSNGVLSGTTTSTGTTTFTVSFTDSAWNTTSRTYTLPVLEHLTPPPSCSLPAAASNRSYAASLSPRGGLPPISWSWEHPYSVSNSPSGWLGHTNARNWKADDQSWPFDLPWPFPFFGSLRTNLWICSNGFIDFEKNTTDYQNSLALLTNRVMIAPLWDDLNTAGGNIHVTTNASHVVIRWDASPYGSTNKLNFEAVLHRAGVIQFNYGTPAASNVAPTVGISAGNGTHYHLASFNGQALIPSYTSVTFAALSPFPPGVSAQPSGVVTGLPLQTGSFTIPCRIRDSATPPETTNFNLYLTVFDSKLTTTQGTPVWWLAFFGLTNTSYNSEDGLDGDRDGMTAWQEYIAGTDPTNRNSALRLLGVTWSNGIPLLEWQSAESPVSPQPPYVVWTSTNPASGTWLPVTNIYTRTPPRNTAPLLPPDLESQAFYRISITN